MKVGGRRVLMNEVIFVPDDEDVTFVCPVEGDDVLPVRMEFPEETIDDNLPEDKRPLPLFSIEYESPSDSIHIDCVVLRFSNFGRGFGQSLAPVPIAVADSKETIFLLASIQKLVKMRRVEFQITVGKDSV